MCDNSEMKMMDTESKSSNGAPQTTTEQVTGNQSEDVCLDRKCVYCKQDVTENSEPQLLPCLHTACKLCIPTDASGNVICPECQQDISSTDIINHLFLMEQLVTNEGKNGEATKTFTCTSCEDSATGTGFCVDCQEWLCDTCIDAHRRVRVTKDHSIRTKEDMEGEKTAGSLGQKYMFCETHKTEKLKLYCETCDTLTCRDCQLQEHKDHKYQFLKHACEQHKQYLNTLLSKIKEKQNLIEGARNLVNKRHNEISQQEQKVTSDIKMFAVRFITEINRRGKLLLQELNDICSKKKEQLSLKNKEFRAMTMKLSQCQRFAEAAINKGSDVALIFSKKAITNQMRTLIKKRCEIPNPQHIVDIKFLYESAFLTQYISQLGCILVDQQPIGGSLPGSMPKPSMTPPQMPAHMKSSEASPSSTSGQYGPPGRQPSGQPPPLHAMGPPRPGYPPPPPGYGYPNMQAPPHLRTLLNTNSLKMQQQQQQQQAQQHMPPHPGMQLQMMQQASRPMLAGGMTYAQRPPMQMMQRVQPISSGLRNMMNHPSPPNQTVSPGHQQQPHPMQHHPSQQPHPQQSPQPHPQQSPQPHPQQSPQPHPQQSPQPHPRQSPQPHHPSPQPHHHQTLQSSMPPQQQQQHQQSVQSHSQPVAQSHSQQQQPAQSHHQQPPQPSPVSVTLSLNPSITISPVNADSKSKSNSLPKPPPLSHSGVQIIPQGTSSLTKAQVIVLDSNSASKQLSIQRTSSSSSPQDNLALSRLGKSNNLPNHVSSGGSASNSPRLGSSDTLSNGLPQSLEEVLDRPALRNTSLTITPVTPAVKIKGEPKSPTEQLPSCSGDRRKSPEAAAAAAAKSINEFATRSISSFQNSSSDFFSSREERNSGSGPQADSTSSPHPTSTAEFTSVATSLADVTMSSTTSLNADQRKSNHDSYDLTPTEELLKLTQTSFDIIPTTKTNSQTNKDSNKDKDADPDVSQIKIVEAHSLKDDPNEDWCAVCHDGGELLCCGSCPRVFHLHCHVPSLNQTPSEDWTCLLCMDVLKCNIPRESAGSKRKNPVGLSGRELLICERVLLEQFCHELSGPFQVPVSRQVPNYYKVIQKPMDLTTIKQKLSPSHFNHYEDVQEFIADVKLIFKNCYTFNHEAVNPLGAGKDSQVCQHARKLEDFFDDVVRKFLPEHGADLAKAQPDVQVDYDSGEPEAKKQKSSTDTDAVIIS